MAKVFVSDKGLATMYDPGQGSHFEVPVADVPALLAEGWHALTRAEVQERAYAKAFDRPGLAAGAGLVRGLVPGGDLLLRGLGVSGETLQRLEKYNPAVSLGSEIAGIGASVLAGPLSALSKIGARAGEGVAAASARALGRQAVNTELGGLTILGAKSTAETVAGKVIGEGITGAAIGAGQAASDMAQGKREATLANFATTTAEGMLIGGAFGAGLEALGAIGGKVASKTRDVLGRVGMDEKKTKALLTAQEKIEREIAYGQAMPDAVAPGAMNILGQELRKVGAKILDDKAARLSGAIVGSVVGGGAPGAIAGMYLGPAITRAAKKILLPIVRRGTPEVEAFGEAFAPGLGREAIAAAPAAEAAAPGVAGTLDVLESRATMAARKELAKAEGAVARAEQQELRASQKEQVAKLRGSLQSAKADAAKEISGDKIEALRKELDEAQRAARGKELAGLKKQLGLARDIKRKARKPWDRRAAAEQVLKAQRELDRFGVTSKARITDAKAAIAKFEESIHGTRQEAVTSAEKALADYLESIKTQAKTTAEAGPSALETARAKAQEAQDILSRRELADLAARDAPELAAEALPTIGRTAEKAVDENALAELSSAREHLNALQADAKILGEVSTPRVEKLLEAMRRSPADDALRAEFKAATFAEGSRLNIPQIVTAGGFEPMTGVAPHALQIHIGEAFNRVRALRRAAGLERGKGAAAKIGAAATAGPVPAVYRYATKSLNIARRVVTGTALTAGRIGKASAIGALTAEDVTETVKHLSGTSPSEAATDVRMTAPSWVHRDHVEELAGEAFRAVSFLQSVAPKPTDDPRWRPSRAIVERFQSAVEGVVDPESLGRQLENGRVRPETRDAVRAVHPAYYEQLARAVIAEIERKGIENVSGPARRSISLLLDDKSILPRIDQPDVAARLAMMMQPAPAGPAQRPAKPPRNIAQQSALQLQNLMRG